MRQGDSPEEMFQLGVQVPDERATGHNLGMAVVEGQSPVAHVFTVDALCPRGDADDFSLLHVTTWIRTYRQMYRVFLFLKLSQSLGMLSLAFSLQYGVLILAFLLPWKPKDITILVILAHKLAP